MIQELEGGVAVEEYRVKAGESYKVMVLQPLISFRSANKIALEYIIQKNTRTITYTPKSEEIPVPKTIKYVPKSRDIAIKCRELVLVPRWDITFVAFNRTYLRKILACSGTILEDTIKYCPKHGFLKKETIAVCEVCGQALCEDHVSRCPICGKWLCEEDGVLCESCGQIYCKEHQLLRCEICGLSICSDCKLTCPICKRTYSRKHMQTCEKCGKNVCSYCVVSVGFFRKKIHCKECHVK